MRALAIVIAHEVGELPLEVRRRPEGHLVEELASDGADEPLDERVRKRHLRHGLDLPDLQNPEVRPPSMESEQRVVVGAQPLRGGPGTAEHLIEHPADGRSVEDTARRIRESAIAANLLDALDDWNSLRSGLRAGRAAPGKLVDLACAVDADDWRSAVRRAGTDIEKLRTIRDNASGDDLPPSGLILLGRSLAACGDVVAGTEVLKEARTRDPGSFRAAFLLAWRLERLEPPRHREAATLYSLLAALAPREAGAHYHHGRALEALKDFSGALVRWETALALDPETFGFLRDRMATLAVNLARTLRVLPKGKAQVPLSELRRIAAAVPDRADLQRELGLALARVESWEEAAKALRKACEIDRADGLSALNLGLALSHLGDASGAAEAWIELIRRGLPSPELMWRPTGRVGLPLQIAVRDAAGPVDSESRALRQAGLVMWSWMEPEAALLAFDESVARERESAELQCCRGGTLARLGEIGKATEAFERAVEIDPKDPQPRYWLGSLRAFQGDVAGAFAIWEAAFALDPDLTRLGTMLKFVNIDFSDGEPAALAHLVSFSLQMGSADATVRAAVAGEAVRRHPSHIGLRRVHVSACVRAGLDHEALDAHHEIVDLLGGKGAEAAAYMGQMARILAEARDEAVRDPEEAVRVARRAQALLGGQGGEYFLGIALHRAGHHREAVVFLEKAPETFGKGLYLALAREALGHREGARKALAEVEARLKLHRGQKMTLRLTRLTREGAESLGVRLER
jgi:tetratricopeptide (TPR) repeat protein